MALFIWSPNDPDIGGVKWKEMHAQEVLKLGGLVLQGIFDGPSKPMSPSIRHDFPDPCVIKVDGTWHAFSTNGANHNIQYAYSNDLARWHRLQDVDVMPVLPRWASIFRPEVWAPDVIQLLSL